jgi:hypothetical protein
LRRRRSLGLLLDLPDHLRADPSVLECMTERSQLPIRASYPATERLDLAVGVAQRVERPVETPPILLAALVRRVDAVDSDRDDGECRNSSP